MSVFFFLTLRIMYLEGSGGFRLSKSWATFLDQAHYSEGLP